MIHRDIIHPRERFVALPLYLDSKLRSLTAQTGNVQKTSFPFGCPYKRCAQPPDSIDVCFDPPCHYVTGLVGANIQITFQFTTIIDEKKIKMLLTSTVFQTKPALIVWYSTHDSSMNIPTLGTKHSQAGNKTFPRWE